MGGVSSEREVSFNSGRTICDHLDTARYIIVPLFQTKQGYLYILPWHFLHRGKTADFEQRLEHEAERIVWDDLKKLIDFMYIALHGQYAEDGTLQGLLEVLDIPYLGSGILTSAIRINKSMQKKVLALNGICTPAGITVSVQEIAEYTAHKETIFECLSQQGITFPVIVKPQNGGSSLGVSRVKTEDELAVALEHACYIFEEGAQPVLIEECINGMEFTCVVLSRPDGTVLFLPPTEVVAQGPDSIFDYEQKYMPGRAVEYTPARCTQTDTEKIQHVCAQIMRLLDIKTIARIDGFLTAEGSVVILECNTLSGMDPASFLFRAAACVGMSHTAVINHLIETELSEYGLVPKSLYEKVMDVNNNKMRVAVLLGGNTNEREISLESGRNVCYKLSPQCYEAIALFVSSTFELYEINQELLVRNSTREIEELLVSQMKVRWADLPARADFVFIALHGGLGENGGVQGMLEMLGVPYNGSSVLASALCMDKHKTNQFLKSQGYTVPDSVFIDEYDWSTRSADVMHTIGQNLDMPVIIKPHDDGCSVMVSKADTLEDATIQISAIFASQKTGVLVEEYIRGTELTVGVIGNDHPQALMPSQVMRSAEILSIEEKFLPGAGENQTPARLPGAAIAFVRSRISQAYKTLGCVGYARIDCFYQTEAESKTGLQELVFIEVNTLPGLTPATCIFHQAAEAGMRPMEFIDLIIQLGCKQHKRGFFADQTHSKLLSTL